MYYKDKIMKNSSSIFFQAVLSVLLISSFAYASPNLDSINGYMGNEWDTYYTDGDTGNDWYVDPGVGGQDYDVEKIGLYIEDSVLYFGLQTGFEINYKEDYVDPGDIAIDIGSDGIYEFALRFSDDGSNSAFLNENYAGTNNVFDANLDIFSIDGDSAWDIGYDGFVAAKPFKLYDGTLLGASTIKAKYSREGGYSYDPYRNTLEGAINFDTLTARLATLGQTINESTNITIHWTMSCGNDYLANTLNYTPTPDSFSQTPEPATLLLFGMGLLGAGAYGRKRQNKEEI
jgi:hypothetical protein